MIVYLDCSLVTPQYLSRLTWIASIPDTYKVVISSTGQLGPIWGPLEPTYLQLVVLGLGNNVLCLTNVVVMNDTISATTESHILFYIKRMSPLIRTLSMAQPLKKAHKTTLGHVICCPHLLHPVFFFTTQQQKHMLLHEASDKTLVVWCTCVPC